MTVIWIYTIQIIILQVFFLLRFKKSSEFRQAQIDEQKKGLDKARQAGHYTENIDEDAGVYIKGQKVKTINPEQSMIWSLVFFDVFLFAILLFLIISRNVGAIFQSFSLPSFIFHNDNFSTSGNFKDILIGSSIFLINTSVIFFHDCNTRAISFSSIIRKSFPIIFVYSIPFFMSFAQTGMIVVMVIKAIFDLDTKSEKNG